MRFPFQVTTLGQALRAFKSGQLAAWVGFGDEVNEAFKPAFKI